MDSISMGELVKVAGGGPELDGIVFDTPSSSKVVVAVVDAARGPVFKTVHPSTLSEREAEAPADQVLRQLIRRTPVPTRGGGAGGSGPVGGRQGHARQAMHRTTGK